MDCRQELGKVREVLVGDYGDAFRPPPRGAPNGAAQPAAAAAAEAVRRF